MFIGFDKPLIVGILNITPDSFSDGGHYLQPDKALEHVFANACARRGYD
ncbi:dihydropteroate synthase [Methylocucumis oryzae]